MRSRYLDVINGYFNREHPYALPIFDSFGLDNDGNYYFDLDNASKAESSRKSEAMDRIRWEWVEMMEKYGGQKLTYVPCPITSGIRPSAWIAEQNEANGFDPEKLITTTYKVDRHMGSELMYKSSVAPNVQDNLIRGAMAGARFPDQHMVMPVVREQATKQMSRNPDFSDGDKYEGEEYMALWVPLVDQKEQVIHVPELLHSRNYIHEIMRAVQIQAGLNPTRPEADMNIPDMDGNEIDLIDLYKQLFEVVRYQTGVGIAPREAATALAQLGDMFDHMSGKRNKISKARTDAGMSAFPETRHENWYTLTGRDAAAFKAVRKDAEMFLKTFCLDAMDRREIDDKFEQWHQEGHGHAPAYSDGLHQRLAGKLQSIRAVTNEMNDFFNDYAAHRESQDPAGLSADRERLLHHVKELAHDFDAIVINKKNGHWNPKIQEIGAQVEELKTAAKTLEGASASNHDRIRDLADDMRAATDSIRNEVNAMLDDKTVSNLRAEAKVIGKNAMELLQTLPSKQNDPDVAERVQAIQAHMRKYSADIDPYHKSYEPAIFNDDLYGQCNKREQAGLPFATGAAEIIYPAANHPYSMRISFDPKTSGFTGEKAAEQGISGTKNIFGAAGEDSVEMTKAALERAATLKDWAKTIRPGKMVYGSDNDMATYDTFARHPDAVAKQGGGYRWKAAARLLHESKFTQLRDDEVVFDHGWWQSEHLVQERVRCVEMQLGLMKRPHGPNLRLYTAPQDLGNLPANPLHHWQNLSNRSLMRAVRFRPISHSV